MVGRVGHQLTRPQIQHPVGTVEDRVGVVLGKAHATAGQDPDQGLLHGSSPRRSVLVPEQPLKGLVHGLLAEVEAEGAVAVEGHRAAQTESGRLSVQYRLARTHGQELTSLEQGVFVLPRLRRAAQCPLGGPDHTLQVLGSLVVREPAQNVVQPFLAAGVGECGEGDGLRAHPLQGLLQLTGRVVHRTVGLEVAVEQDDDATILGPGQVGPDPVVAPRDADDAPLDGRPRRGRVHLLGSLHQEVGGLVVGRFPQPPDERATGGRENVLVRVALGIRGRVVGTVLRNEPVPRVPGEQDPGAGHEVPVDLRGNVVRLRDRSDVVPLDHIIGDRLCPQEVSVRSRQ